MYTFGKKLVQIFAPNMVTAQQWIYADFLAPILFTPSNKGESTLINTGGRSDVRNDLQSNETKPENIEQIIKNYTYDKLDNFNNSIVDSVNLTRSKRTPASIDKYMGSSSTNEDVIKNLAFLENDPNAVFKPSSPFFHLLTGSNRGCFNISI